MCPVCRSTSRGDAQCARPTPNAPLLTPPPTPPHPPTPPQVDLYENGTIAIVEAVSPELGNRIQRVRVQLPGTSSELLQKFRDRGVDFAAHSNTEDGGAVFLNLLGNLAFPLLLVGGLFLLSRRQGGGMGPGGPGNPMAFGKSKARFQMEPNTGITFADVAGVDEAKQDFQEVGWAVGGGWWVVGGGARLLGVWCGGVGGRRMVLVAVWGKGSSSSPPGATRPLRQRQPHPPSEPPAQPCAPSLPAAAHHPCSRLSLYPAPPPTQIVEFLKKPERFTAVGARIPKGVLLVGPPGERAGRLAGGCRGGLAGG